MPTSSRRSWWPLRSTWCSSTRATSRRPGSTCRRSPDVKVFQNPKRAQKELAAVGAALGEPARERAEALAAQAADPDALVASFERALPALKAGGRDPAALVDLLAPLLEASELASRTLATRPGLLRWLLGSRSL